MNIRILNVDDSLSSREIIKGCLLKEGYEVESVENGPEALNKLKTEKAFFDLLIIDYHMPEMDGITLAKEIRSLQDYSDTPILMVTSEQDVSLKLKGAQSGVNGWVTKPFDQSKFISVVNQMAS
ncbi:MAG: response regulator [Spirochaetota bacterium]|nr:response regulator [Spirochaetota bacterium]